MGQICCGGQEAISPGQASTTATFIKQPKPWSAAPVINTAQLERMRREFWETRIEGRQVVWETLKGVVDEPETDMKILILQSAGIVVIDGDLSEVYDELGAKYELPNYILSDPTNLVHNT
eukprot:TRINITY_DN2062_c0_g1_i1.p1 TRINITY_DN2062_c0_g1~~TRINITY_DN2062_c0_g1_i1.p1  ORF type:complete len:120 (-),score=21.88 TRINITY_DN2062_c0_g1_i1:117-476(-)